MLDLSPEKLMMLLVVGLMVLGPERLPSAARSAARALARARQLAATVTEPVMATLAEPKRVADEAVGEMRRAVRAGGSAPEP